MKIVIVGGGTAGWIATWYLSSCHECINISTDEIPIIGVGEGTTGKFVDLFQLTPKELQSINALPKLGIKFDGRNKDDTSFWSPIDHTPTAHNYIDYSLYASGPTSIFTSLMEDNKTNFSLENNFVQSNFPVHALHIDAYKTSAFFKEKSLGRNVKHYNEKVVSVNRENGKIVSLDLSGGINVEAEIYIDCSGFSRVLSDNSEWIDYSNYLPVNSALVYKKHTEDSKNPYTVAKAMNYGWTWEIPTSKKIGRGYVYCDKYTSEDEIIKELGDVEKIKSIKFKSGRLSTFMNHNCVSVGLASGFLEPLQATSIHTTLIQLELFAHSFSTPEMLNDIVLVNQYNDTISTLWDHMRDFVSLHYSGGKTNTEFWTNFIFPDRVEKILHLAKTRLTRSYDFSDYVLGDVGQESWNPILWGLKHFSNCPLDEVLPSDCDTIEWWRSNKLELDTSKYLPVNEFLQLNYVPFDQSRDDSKSALVGMVF